MQEAPNNKRLTRREKRLLIRGNNTNNNSQKPVSQKINFKLKNIRPLTENQTITFDKFYEDYNLLLHGIAGCGKTFLSLYLSLREVLENADSIYKKVVIVRSVVPTRDIGFLPGNQKEKVKVYEAPYYAICTELFGRGDSYEYFKNRNIIEFTTTSFIRGVTLNDSIVIVDECQNLTGHELDTIITRIGDNCRIIFCGDFRQTDFIKESDKSGIHDFMKILHNMKSFYTIEFQAEDIVRSNLVREYIILKDKLRIKI